MSKSHPKVGLFRRFVRKSLSFSRRFGGTSFFVDHHLLWFSILKAFLKILHRVQGSTGS